MTLRRPVRLAAIAASVIGVLVPALLACYAIFVRSTAEHLRDDLATLTVGVATYQDAQRVEYKYRHSAWHDWRAWDVPTRLYGGPRFEFTSDEPCTQSRCAIAFRVDNDLLAAVHLVDRARFIAMIAILDNRVASVEMHLSGGHSGHAGIVEYTDCCPRFERSSAYEFPTPVGKPYLLVSISNAATAEQKRHAFALDMKCLVNRGDCEWSCQYLPLAWKDYAASLLNKDDIEWFSKAGMKCP